MSKTILVVGSINIDLVIRTPRIPAPGQNVYGKDFRIIPGGKGANQAVGVARMGGKTFLAGRVGNDSFGATMLASLHDAGIDATHVERDRQAATGVALIMVDANGENSIVIAAGANAEFSIESAEKLAGVIGSVDLVLCNLELPAKPVARVIEQARMLGIPTVLDAGPPCTQPEPAFFQVTVLTPNVDEAAALTGRPVTDRTSASEVARYLLEQGPEAVVLKMGSEGALLATSEGEEFYPAHKVSVVDTTAAGDAFSAALSVALAEGQTLPDAVRFANAAGALAVTKLGAQPSLPARSELERFLATIQS